MTPWGITTTADEVASALSDHIRGKTVLITGVSPGGLGAVSALAISKHNPALLILAGRSTTKCEMTATEINEVSPGVPTKVLSLDLGSLKSVRAAAAEVNAYPDVDKIDVLINNAGVMASPYMKTEDGFENQWQINHLGCFLFTNLLVPKIREGGRIVVVSSDGHRLSDIRYDDIGFQDGKVYDRWMAYGQSKTGNMLFARGLAEKLASRGIKAFSLHPGVITSTSLGAGIPMDEIMDFVQKHPAPEGTILKTPEQGTATHIVAAFDPSIEGQNGLYLNHCNIQDPIHPYATDLENARRCWRFSEELLGKKFEW